LPNIPKLTWFLRSSSSRLPSGGSAKNTIPPRFCLPFRSASCHPFNERVPDRGSGTGSAGSYPGMFYSRYWGRSSRLSDLDARSARDVHDSRFFGKRFALVARERRLLPSSCEGGARQTKKPGRWIATSCQTVHSRAAFWLESWCCEEREPQANARPCGVRRWHPASWLRTSANPWPLRPVGCWSGNLFPSRSSACLRTSCSPEALLPRPRTAGRPDTAHHERRASVGI
jgi:hypothetical protein